MDFNKLKDTFKMPEFWVVILGFAFFVFIFGILVGISPTPEEVEPEIKEVEVEKEVEKVVEVEKIVEKEVCKKEDSYNELIKVDTKLIGLKDQGILICGEMIVDAAQDNAAKLMINTQRVEDITPQIQTLTIERMLLLEKIK